MAVQPAPQISREGDVTVVYLGAAYENLDEDTVRELREVIVDVVMEADPPKVVLDLSRTTFFGSSFIEVLFRAHARIRERGGQFVICGVTDYCAEVVEVVHLERLITIYDDLSSAVDALSAK